MGSSHISGGSRSSWRADEQTSRDAMRGTPIGPVGDKAALVNSAWQAPENVSLRRIIQASALFFPFSFWRGKVWRCSGEVGLLIMMGQGECRVQGK